MKSLFILASQQTFIEYLQCVGHCSEHWVHKVSKFSATVELIKQNRQYTGKQSSGTGNGLLRWSEVFCGDVFWAEGLDEEVDPSK